MHLAHFELFPQQVDCSAAVKTFSTVNALSCRNTCTANSGWIVCRVWQVLTGTSLIVARLHKQFNEASPETVKLLTAPLELFQEADSFYSKLMLLRL